MEINMNENILYKIAESGFSLQKLAVSYPELLALDGVPQNPEYHGEGDVLRHTEMVCGELTKLAPWQALPEEEKALLFLAAAFHDIGKPACTKQEEGKWVSPKHTLVGEKIFRRIAYQEAERFGLTFKQRELVAKLIRYHGLPLWFWTKKQPELELCKAAESIPLKLLYLLSKADTLGRRETLPSQLPDLVELFGEYARELDLWEHPYVFANPYTKFQFFQKENLWQGDQLYDDTTFD
ncbi:MAG: HD domain-containing protein, partial [Acetatifactor sp.]|nr:HD domain-containing protein [Acetatifactor sp.]